MATTLALTVEAFSWKVFCESRGDSLSTAYVPVPARLQYGCSNFPAAKNVPRRYLLELGILYNR